MTQVEYILHPIRAIEVVKNEIIATSQVTNQRRKKFPVPAIKRVTHESTSWTPRPSARSYKKRHGALFHTTIQHCNPSVPSHRFHCDGESGALTTRAHSDSRHVRQRPASVRIPAKSEVISAWAEARQRRPNGIRRRARLASGERGGAGATHATRRLSRADYR